MRDIDSNGNQDKINNKSCSTEPPGVSDVQIEGIDFVAPYPVAIGAFYFQFIFSRRQFGDNDIRVILIVNPFVGKVDNAVAELTILIVDKIMCGKSQSNIRLVIVQSECMVTDTFVDILACIVYLQAVQA